MLRVSSFIVTTNIVVFSHKIIAEHRIYITIASQKVAEMLGAAFLNGKNSIVIVL